MYPENLIADPSAIVRRSLYLDLGGYEPLVGEDYEFWMRALSAGATFYFEPRLVVRLREHGGNLSYRALEIWETKHLIHRALRGARAATRSSSAAPSPTTC